MQEWDEFNLNLLVHIIQQEEFSTIVKGFISLGESRSDFFLLFIWSSLDIVFVTFLLTFVQITIATQLQ